MRRRVPILLSSLLTVATIPLTAQIASRNTAPTASATVFGFVDFAKQAAVDSRFLTVPSAALAGAELKTLTAVPHIAGSKEDYQTALFVARKFKEAGLDTEIVEYKVRFNYPEKIVVEAYGPRGELLMRGPTPEHVVGDPYQKDPRIVTPYNGQSPSGEITAEAVYGNYCRLEDFNKLDELKIDVKGKIVLCRYGGNFRGVKAFIAEKRRAAGVILYSDPADDGYFRGDKYPAGPWRPETGVQRGSIGYMFEYPGDPETPGIASTPDLPDSRRIPYKQAPAQPKILCTPISYHDAAPILQRFGGTTAPRSWQGALPFTYHLGNGRMNVKVHLLLKQDYKLRSIWDVIGKIPGSDSPDEWVVAGNHRDAWVYGAVDPSSGTASMLESVHGLGTLLRQGWKPKRTIVIASWDAEEEGLMGSTEWVEQHDKEMAHTVAYFNMDVAVSGPSFSASAVPSLKQFLRDVARSVPSPKGGTVYEQWKMEQNAPDADRRRQSHLHLDDEVSVGELGSGSDFTPFFQHAGVPSTDIGSNGPYGVYHSAFDNFAWYVKNADPDFSYLKQMAGIFGIEVLHMADADVLPYDYVLYAREIHGYLKQAQKRAADASLSGVDFSAALAAADRLSQAARAIYERQLNPGAKTRILDAHLRAAEDALLSPAGLPHRAWYKHTIFAPGEYTGYEAVVIPGVNEAINSKDAPLAIEQLSAVTDAINRAALALEQTK